METKVFIIGNDSKSNELKPVEFVHTLLSTKVVTDAKKTPKDYKFIELIAKNYCNDMDLIFAHNGNRNDITENGLYIGYFNSGLISINTIN